MSPSCQKEICKKRNPQYGGGESFSENDARHESDTSIQESDEPKHKKARYSVGTVKSNNSETFHPSIAEKIKLRERKYSQSYDENQGRSVAGKESSKKSPRHLTSCHPYMRRKDSSPGHSPGHSTSKIFIEKTFYTNNMSLNLSDKDKNHNELSDLGNYTVRPLLVTRNLCFARLQSSSSLPRADHQLRGDLHHRGQERQPGKLRAGLITGQGQRGSRGGCGGLGSDQGVSAKC